MAQDRKSAPPLEKGQISRWNAGCLEMARSPARIRAMEIIRRHVAAQPTGFAAYIALQCALMRRYLARGGTAEDFCQRLAPVYRRRFAPVLLGEGAGGLGNVSDPEMK